MPFETYRRVGPHRQPPVGGGYYSAFGVRLASQPQAGELQRSRAMLSRAGFKLVLVCIVSVLLTAAGGRSPLAWLFDSQPVLWVQSWATPALTHVMNGISLFGYTPSYIALAVLLAFGYRLRAGAGLLLLLALTAALSDAAKIIVGFPRPDAVDPRVAALGLFQQVNQEDREPPGIIDPGDAFGFPSGHVAATTAFLIGLALVYRWGWAWKAMLVWIPLMGLSRVYLGRHFVGDVLGGVAVGVLAAAIGTLWWKLRRIENPARGWCVARRGTLTGAGLTVL